MGDFSGDVRSEGLASTASPWLKPDGQEISDEAWDSPYTKTFGVVLSAMAWASLMRTAIPSLATRS